MVFPDGDASAEEPTGGRKRKRGAKSRGTRSEFTVWHKRWVRNMKRASISQHRDAILAEALSLQKPPPQLLFQLHVAAGQEVFGCGGPVDFLLPWQVFAMSEAEEVEEDQ